LATVGELQRQIGLLEGLVVELFDREGHVLGQGEELGVGWPYTRRTRGRVTVAEWRSARISPLRPGLKVWVMSGAGYPVGKHTPLKEVRATWGHGYPDGLVEASLPETDRASAVIVIGDRNLAIVPPDLGDRSVAEGTYGLAVVARRTERQHLRVWVSSDHVTGMVQLAEVTMKIPSRVLRIQDTEGTWHTDIPCKRPRITVYADRASAPSAVMVVVDRRRELAKSAQPVDLHTDPRFRARERNAFEQRLAAGSAWVPVRGTIRRWRRDDLVEAAERLSETRRGKFPPVTVSRPGPGVVAFSSSVRVEASFKEDRKKRKTKKKGRKASKRAKDQAAEVARRTPSTTSETYTDFAATAQHGPDRTVPAGHGRLAFLLLTRRLPYLLDLDVVGQDVVAGRPCEVVDAVLRPDNVGSTGLPMESGVSFRLYVDTERLVVLRAVNLVDGEAAEIVEFLDVTFDEGHASP
jgi:hypothetical protein